MINIIFWSICLFSFLLTTFVISYYFKECFIEALVVSTSLLLLLLYILAFFRGMLLIIPISLCLLLFYFFTYYKMGTEGKSKIREELKLYFIDKQLVISISLIVIIAVLTSKHIYFWWDDINFWGTDAKALFYLNGFTGKYGNVSPEFGDYPPIIQIMKWCFMKLSGNYNEGLSFSGYYVMMFIYLLPLFKKVKDSNILIQIFLAIILILLPGVCNKIWSEGTCTDVIMGIIFGAFLISTLDYNNHGRTYYYIRESLLLSIICLCKSSGIEWLCFGVIFLICIYNYGRKNNIEIFNSKRIYICLSILFSFLVQGSWWLYCLLNRRIAKLTSSGVHMARRGFALPDNYKDKLLLYIKAFAFYPMHTDESIVFDLSSMELLIVILIVFILIGYRKKEEKIKFRIIILYSSIISLITYVVILAGHMTIFSGETQYETAQVLAISISRYASPLTIGLLMLAINLIFESFNLKLALLISGIFILITTDYLAYYNVVIGYRKDISTHLFEREEMIDEAGKKYISCVENNHKLWGHRVLYLRDNNTIHWLKDTYISYYSSPVPTIYDGFDENIHNTSDIIDIINKNHATYLYVDPQSDKGIDIFNNIMAAGDFKYATIYKVNSDGNAIVLEGE